MLAPIDESELGKRINTKAIPEDIMPLIRKRNPEESGSVRLLEVMQHLNQAATRQEIKAKFYELYNKVLADGSLDYYLARLQKRGELVKYFKHNGTRIRGAYALKSYEENRKKIASASAPQGSDNIV